MNEHHWRVLDATVIGATVATLLHWMTEATIVLEFGYIIIRAFETHTVKAALSRLKQWLSD